MSVTLAKDAGFGRLAFDLFAIEKWDREAELTPEESKPQWEQLAWGYQRLTLIERWVLSCPSPPLVWPLHMMR
ncbi:hypothetical protein N7527_011663 [Penicillium freii]|nr:hypothetical protein N7527_011663 [Penicillium freii]